eukprot:548129_1
MATPSASFKPFAVVIKNHYFPTYSLRLVIDSEEITIGKLKTQIEEQHKGHQLIQDQLLVHRGKLLESRLNLCKLFESSIIVPQSPPNAAQSPTQDTTNTMSTMYIHMTLRGGSNTATKIGLTATIDTVPMDDAPSKSDSKQTNDATSSPQEHTEVQKEEEKKQPQPATSSAPIPPHIPPQFTQLKPPHYPHYPPYHHPYYPPPPDPYYLSRSMPDLMHPAYVQRTQSVPSNNKPSHPFHPPTLVQQTSNTQQYPQQYQPQYPQQYPHYPPPPFAHHYPPYGAMPPPPPHHYHPPFAPFPPHSQSMSDLNALREQGAPNWRNQTFIPSKIDEKEEKKEANRPNNNGSSYGLRRRRVANGANAPNNAVNEDDNANVAEANNVVNENNANANNNENALRDRWFVRLFRALNINVLIRLGIFMWFFGPNLGKSRFTILCMIGTLYYLHQVGLLQRLFGFLFVGRNRNDNEPRHRDPLNDDRENNDSVPPVPIPLPTLSYVQLLQRFLIGIVASLWPTWDHTTLYPVPVPQ